ncbi:Cytochrome oxidase maturation protein cbb3-type [Rubripirellula amarantea]|uniref:Cytochrome oxidase maturation protein cbb3-type n=1 Tax=Rubripirellula amarantea TaxID=2527999 RepID=A0A5C5WN73_9BACT|nr:cbb3-type cytochrome oxidase assembly protein CcoS [Rubripirellula amarantea]TWT51242.1 Cytochrome oxidase maturation protein cbb3-type [Rubripirellula amarantea]
MSVLYVALPVAILMGAAAMIACIKCIRGGQYDDLEGASVRMLIDDEPIRNGTAKNGTAKNRSTKKS